MSLAAKASSKSSQGWRTLLHKNHPLKVYFLSLAILLAIAVGIGSIYLGVLSNRCARRLVHRCRMDRMLLEHLQLATSRGSP